jgi:peroxiredoxin
MKTPRLVSNPDLARRSLVLAMATSSAAGWSGCTRLETLPAFEYTLLDGSRGHSAAQRGQVLLLNFWATSCAICVAEMPALVATHQRYASRGLLTLAVAMKYDPPAYVSDFAQSRRLPFGVVIDNTGTIARSVGDVKATPTTFVIDKRGAIAKTFVGAPDFNSLHGLLEKLLAEA